jgi:hypothetical protein
MLKSDVYTKYPTPTNKAKVRIPAPIDFPKSVIESIIPLPYMAGSGLGRQRINQPFALTIGRPQLRHNAFQQNY